MKRSIEIHWEITNDCNLRCRHCIVSAGDFKNTDSQYEDIINFIDKLKDQEDVLLSFTGGEPFSRKEFKKMLKHCVEYGIKIQIITNGMLFDKASLEIIKNYNIQLGISVESFKKENFEQIRGLNTFDKLMLNIKKLRSLNIPFDIYTTINNYNIYEIEDILQNAKELGARVHFNELTVDGRAKKNSDIITDTNNILDIMLTASKIIFGEDEMGYEDNCWATNDILFIDNSGNIYLCTEQNRCNKKTKLGNIKSFPINEYYKNCPTLDYFTPNNLCPYKVYYNEYITYVSNVPIECCLLSRGEMINDLKTLYKAFDNLFSDILISCIGCNYKDCMGFIWLFDEERKICDENGITTININDDIDFLNFAKDYDLEEIELENMSYPKCEHRCEKTGKCLIHELRPLVCHMYPIGLETSESGTDMWVLHDECQFVQNLIRTNKISEFISRAISIIDRINTSLYSEIVLKYRQVDDISLFLNGINSYIILKEVDWECQNVKQC